jgi:hypothetical protein
VVGKCANQKCNRDFHYLAEGRLFAFRHPRCSRQQTQYWWLCGKCAETLTIHFDRDGRVHVVSKTKLETNECTRCMSLYRCGLVESYCSRCGRFLGASIHESLLAAAEEAHHCAPATSLAVKTH